MVAGRVFQRRTVLGEKKPNLKVSNDAPKCLYLCPWSDLVLVEAGVRLSGSEIPTCVAINLMCQVKINIKFRINNDSRMGLSIRLISFSPDFMRLTDYEGRLGLFMFMPRH